ncbi:hypothetical protein COS91_06755 [Candidatus Desantisbacteria bacterium CG07_land_8_20_14_0_80_39_15]|uniref:Uncharacterized protein n=2 Tax=unclassified Candidatus Desantisiibacteriota TaxID=3106372 RepID=A0A2H9PD54_9BACT|nr:MAG: hypothetical protein COS91_06755 [Candidatus Desantisbacteria bacterium CG07_land_8_20_14_0_80_39_15]PIZ17378.1 MAG: hypothetical protein COY51_00310 [Candidatus Desantisbacteria bacterium CG_4_10_14_0_8_um_filter_39_17]
MNRKEKKIGNPGKLKEKYLARNLRKQGFSYKEIIQKVEVSKSTVSQWCRDIELSEKEIQRLCKKRKAGGLKGSIKGAKIQQRLRIENTNFLMREGIKEIGKLNRRENLIAGAMLFASEGTKRDGSVDFANSDPRIISFMMKWLIEVCNVPKEKIKAKLYIHENLDEYGAREFWSNLINLPLYQFNKSYIAKNNVDRIRKNIHPYGVLTLRVYDSKLHRKIMGWIQGILFQWFPGSSAVEHAAVERQLPEEIPDEKVGEFKRT